MNTTRTLDRRTGDEGPRHDPYGYTRRIVTVNGWQLILHVGLVCYFTMHAIGTRQQVIINSDGNNGARHAAEHWQDAALKRRSLSMSDWSPLIGSDAAAAEAVHMWQVATGLTTRGLDRAYDRVHPYFDDPMGCAADYV